MSQALSAVHVHLVFSTKERRPFLRQPDLRAALHAYLGGISRELECPPVIIGGVEDHVHILARLGRTLTQAEWVKELKRVSTMWLRTKASDLTLFQWQGGYAAFSVSQSNLDPVKAYVADQETHHRKMTFQDELRTLARKHDLKIDERYAWD